MKAHMERVRPEIKIDHVSFMTTMSSIFALKGKCEAIVLPNVARTTNQISLIPRLFQIELSERSYVHVSIDGQGTVVDSVTLEVYPDVSTANGRDDHIFLEIDSKGVTLAEDVVEIEEYPLIQEAIRLIPLKCFHYLLRSVSDANIAKVVETLPLNLVLDGMTLMANFAHGDNVGPALMSELTQLATQLMQGET